MIRKSRILSLANSEITLVETSRLRTTIQLDILGAGPACADDPLKAIIAAAVVRRSVDKSGLIDDGATADLVDRVAEPDVTIVASGPSSSSGRWFSELEGSILTPTIGQSEFDTIRRNVVTSVARAPTRPLRYGSLLADTAYTPVDVSTLIRTVRNSASADSRVSILKWIRQHYRVPSFRMAVSAPSNSSIIRQVVGIVQSFDHTPQVVVESRCELHDQSRRVLPSHFHLTANTPQDAIFIAGSPLLMNRRESPLLMVANRLLGSGPESRLRRTVRDQRGLSYDVRSTIDLQASGIPWVITASSSRKDFLALVGEIASQVQQLGKQGPTSQELSWAKESLLNERAMNSENPSHELYGLLSGIPQDETLRITLETITCSDIANVVSEAFLSHCGRIVVVGSEIDFKLIDKLLGPICSGNEGNVEWIGLGELTNGRFDSERRRQD
ncbi:MAG TPA: insulinase family protein [Terriglobia bacterium]|nr:insulinase family protein [Terriglobia bacterium]